MNFLMVLPVEFKEWGWLFGFALVSLGLVALAVLADAVYEGYRARVRLHAGSAGHAKPDSQLSASRKKTA